MKLKAVLFDDTPPDLIEALEKLRPHVMEKVLVPHLKVPGTFGPAEFYIQRSDHVVKDSATAANLWMCEVRLTGVSGPNVNFGRSVQDFWEAAEALTEVYRREIRSHLPVGHRAQLFVVIMIDESIPINRSGAKSPLIEVGPEFIDGEGVPRNKSN